MIHNIQQLVYTKVIEHLKENDCQRKTNKFEIALLKHNIERIGLNFCAGCYHIDIGNDDLSQCDICKNYACLSNCTDYMNDEIKKEYKSRGWWDSCTGCFCSLCNIFICSACEEQNDINYCWGCEINICKECYGNKFEPDSCKEFNCNKCHKFVTTYCPQCIMSFKVKGFKKCPCGTKPLKKNEPFVNCGGVVNVMKG